MWMNERTNQAMEWTQRTKNARNRSNKHSQILCNLVIHVVQFTRLVYLCHCCCCYCHCCCVCVATLKLYLNVIMILLAFLLACLLRTLGKKRYRNFVSCVKMSVREARDMQTDGWTGESKGGSSELRWPTVNSMIAKILKRTNACARVWVAVDSLFAIAFICYALFEGLRCYCCWEHKKSDVPHGNRSLSPAQEEKKYADNTRDSSDSPFIFVIVHIELISNEFVFLLRMPCQMNHLQPNSQPNTYIQYGTVRHNTCI